LNYNERNFRPMISDVYDAATNLSVAFGVPFRPKQSSYGAMLNFGSMALGKGLGIDMYMGMGATYNQFDLNGGTYKRTTHTFSHPLLNGRKETFWGFQMRLGITVGLSLETPAGSVTSVQHHTPLTPAGVGRKGFYEVHTGG
jgi:hypothetical protein